MISTGWGVWMGFFEKLSFDGMLAHSRTRRWEVTRAQTRHFTGRDHGWCVCMLRHGVFASNVCTGGGGAACGVRFVGTVLDTDENTRPLFVALECVHRGNG